MSTLNYANMAKLILNKPQKNEISFTAGGGTVTTSKGLSTKGPAGNGDVWYVRPFAGGVPVKARIAAPEPEEVVPIGVPVARSFDVTAAAWVNRCVLDPTGRLLPDVRQSFATCVDLQHVSVGLARCFP